MVNKGTATDVNKSKPRTISVDDALWERVMAAKGERSVSEWMRSAMTDMLDGVDTGAVDDEFNRIKAERDAALKLAKLAEENVARLEADAVRIPPVPSVDTQPSKLSLVVTDLEPRIAARARALNMEAPVWLREYLEAGLARPVSPDAPRRSAGQKAPDDGEREAAILEEAERRKTAHVANGGQPYAITRSRFAHLKVAPADSPNVKWKMHQEIGPPAWMTAPTTKPGMTKDDALALAMTTARHVMSGKTD